MAFTDECGYLDKELSYDAWGRRRSADTWDYYGNSVDSIAGYDRGFTGHEHIDMFDMVNMDGRMYDPVVGRFLSPDPYVQMPDFTQSLNRYAYCINSPLSLTDPSGYNWMGDLMATAVGVAVGLETCGLATGIYGAIIGGALGGASSSLVGAVLNGANLWQTTKGVFTGAFWGAASAAIDFQIGELENVFERIALQSVSEGVVEGVRGGHFEHGLLVGFASSAGGELINRYGNKLPYVGKIAANAALGGCVSVLGGGKFANGAMTAAYTMMFNDLMHDGDDGNDEKSCSVVISELEERGGVYYLNGHIIGEKPMESIWPEFDILTGLRGALNTIVSFSTNAKAITTFLNGNHFTRLKGGVRQAFIERTDINKLFRSLASKCNAKIHYNGTEEYFKVGKYRVGLHNSSHGGGKTIHINYNNREKLYKIRSK